MAPKNRNQRISLTRYFVPHASSSWFLRGALVTSLLTWGFFSFAAGYFHEAQLKPLAAYPALDAELQSDLVRAAVRSSSVVLGGAAITFLLFCMYSLHRIVGPLYALQRHMAAIIEGAEPKELSFRSHDRNHDLAWTYNTFLVHAGLMEPPAAEGVPAKPDSDAAPELAGRVPAS